ncbi:Uncharacterised protein [uncultured archaeon]|nr:Uncharacterised protein [uncultured archaeon]
MLFHLGRFEGYAFCDHERHTAPDPIGLDPLEVAPSFHFIFLRWLAVYADGAVANDQTYFIFCGKILQMYSPVICGDLFDVPLHLFRSRDEAVNPQTSPDIVGCKYRKRLRSAARAAYRSCIIDPDIFGSVVVLCKVYLGNALDRRCHYPFC